MKRSGRACIIQGCGAGCLWIARTALSPMRSWMASGWSAMSKIPGAARSDKAKETHMDKLTPFFKKKKRILKKGLTKRRKAGILTERLTEGMKKQESGRKRPGGSRTDFRKRAEKSA